MLACGICGISNSAEIFLFRYRIRQEKNGGAWCPKAQISSDVREYLQIDLPADHIITQTETQGRFGNGQGQEFAEYFLIEYWRTSLGRWVLYKDANNKQVSFFSKEKMTRSPSTSGASVGQRQPQCVQVLGCLRLSDSIHN